MSFFPQILPLLLQLAGILLALWLLFLLGRFTSRAWAQRSRPRVPRAKRSRRVRHRPISGDRRQGPRREADLVEAALANRPRKDGNVGSYH